MARWQPNAPERLVVAALDLFSERGYENTTVIDIAERAGLTKSTFFRHFPDKREVLFGGDGMSGLLAEGIAAAPHGRPHRSKRWLTPWTQSGGMSSCPRAVRSPPGDRR